MTWARADARPTIVRSETSSRSSTAEHRPDQSRVGGQVAEHVTAVPAVECAIGPDALLDKPAGLLEICHRCYTGDAHTRSVLLATLRSTSRHRDCRHPEDRPDSTKARARRLPRSLITGTWRPE